jgi:hypothetical protein
MNQKARSLLRALPALAGSASAQIDSGGGKVATRHTFQDATIKTVVRKVESMTAEIRI